MVLMRVIPAMRENKIRIGAAFKSLEPRLYLCALFREETILEGHHLDLGALSRRQEISRRGPCFLVPVAAATAAQDTPLDIDANAALHHAEERRAGSYFNVVRMCTQTQDGQWPAGIDQLQCPHRATPPLNFDCGRQGISPRSTISSSTCRSRSVSMARQNPSYL